jgi:hypothetical protein
MIPDATTPADVSQVADASVDVSSASFDGPQDAPNDAPTGCDQSLAWTKVPGSPAGFAISGSGPSDIWLLGTQSAPFYGPLMRGDGFVWNPVRLEAGVLGGNALWVSGPNDVLLGGQAVSHWNGSAWSGYSLQDNRVLGHFWGTSPTDVWGSAASSSYLGHWDGRQWFFDADRATGPLAGGARGDFWAVNSTALAHQSPADANFSFSYDVTVSFGSLGYDAGMCSVFGTCLNGAWASATDDVWFVGEAGIALHYDGAAWRLETLPVSATLRGIWGSSRNDIWAAGDLGVLLHFDGVRWSQGPTLTTAALASVWMSGPCDVWVIGDAVYHGAPHD